MGSDFEPDIQAEFESVMAQRARNARKKDDADLMWLVISAIHNKLMDDGHCAISKGSPTADVIAEIVAKVEGWK